MNLIEVPFGGELVKAEMVEGVWSSENKALADFLNSVEGPGVESGPRDVEQVEYCADLMCGKVLEVDDCADDLIVTDENDNG